jgi:4-hydroxythreonine-4-phosphate dehydrogenase
LSITVELVNGAAPLAVALGDPAGVGPEVVAKAWTMRAEAALPVFFAVGDRHSIELVWDGPIRAVSSPAEACAAFDTALPLIQMDDPGPVTPGEPSLAGARCALDSLEVAVGLARTGTAGGLVTGPVAKSQLYAIGFSHPGQTEFVAERCGVSPENAVMLMVGRDLRTVPITIHIPLAQVATTLSVDLIVSRGRTTARGLARDFGIERPRLAVVGLNPHAGEDGTIGDEEREIIKPAIEALRNEGIDAFGPLAADTLFHEEARRGYDAVLCMYHDQALIPLKTIAFDEGVNLSLGLPIVRASPDHGTAFDIAGTGRARPNAMIAAIRLAASCASRRAENV